MNVVMKAPTGNESVFGSDAILQERCVDNRP